MAPEIGFVPHAGQGQADESALQGLGDGLADGGLAGARGAGEAQDGSPVHLQVPLFLNNFPDGGAQLVQLDGLGEIVGRAFLEGVHRGADGGVARHHDDFGAGRHLLDGLQQLDAVHLLHLQVREDDVELLGLDLLQGLHAVGRNCHLVPFFAQDVLQVGAGDFFVIHHQDLGGLQAAQGAHRQVFQDALLDVLEAVVLGVQDVFGPLQVQVVLGEVGPGQRDQIIQVIEANGVFGHGRVRLFQALQLLQGHRGQRFGQLGPLDGGAQVRQFRGYLGALLFCFPEENHAIHLSVRGRNILFFSIKEKPENGNFRLCPEYFLIQ